MLVPECSGTGRGPGPVGHQPDVFTPVPASSFPSRSLTLEVSGLPGPGGAGSSGLEVGRNREPRELLMLGLDPCSCWGVTCQAEFGTGSAWRGDILLNLEVLFHSEMHCCWQPQ